MNPSSKLILRKITREENIVLKGGSATSSRGASSKRSRAGSSSVESLDRVHTFSLKLAVQNVWRDKQESAQITERLQLSNQKLSM